MSAFSWIIVQTEVDLFSNKVSEPWTLLSQDSFVIKIRIAVEILSHFTGVQEMLLLLIYWPYNMIHLL